MEDLKQDLLCKVEMDMDRASSALCLQVQETPLSDWRLPEPMLLDSKENENNTCLQNQALQQQVAELQARLPRRLVEPRCTGRRNDMHASALLMEQWSAP